MTEKNYKYAVVDLEATGAHSNAKIIQVGIVIIENGKITKTYETDVNPHEKLDYHIQELTGLTDDRLAKAPDFSQVASQIYQLLEGAIFVAHNVRFDANLLAEELLWEGFDIFNPRVDTVELTQIFFPTLAKYGLGYLNQLFDLKLEQAHTAISDAQATARLLMKIQERIRLLPKLLVEEILSLGDHLLFESRLVIEEVYEQMTAVSRGDLEETHGLFLKRSVPDASEEVLSQDFKENIALLKLEERPLQDQFVTQIMEAIEGENSIAFLQAQTGLGKTYAYLLTLLARNEHILVSVPTKLLQNQILSQEGMAIQKKFHIPFHSLKGYRNYIKLDFFHSSLRHDDGNRLNHLIKMGILVWLTETETGDLDEFGQQERYQNYFAEIRHDGKLEQTSLFSSVDFWKKSQEKIRTSKVLITNHAYLLTRLEDDPSLLEGRRLVVDEAQKLFLALEYFSRSSLSMTEILQEIQEELKQTTSLLVRRLLESLQFELNHAQTNYLRHRKKLLASDTLQKMRQDLSELPSSYLLNLRQLVKDEKGMVWLEEEWLAGNRTIYLKSAPREFLSFRKMLPTEVPALFISATLEISKKVQLPQLLGFNEFSVFKLAERDVSHQKILIDTYFPNPADIEVSRYAEEIVSRLENLATLQRPILCLFTSKELLLKTSEYLNLPHLAQYKNGDAVNIKRRFDKGETTILLGAASFWEGTDFVSQPQMLVVVTRLPFDNPTDFFVQKMNQHLREEGKNPFYDYSLPTAILKLKQAIGRSNRREEQESIVILLDNRVYTKRYSQQIIASLKAIAPVEMQETSKIVENVAHFFGEERNG